MNRHAGALSRLAQSGRQFARQLCAVLTSVPKPSMIKSGLAVTLADQAVVSALNFITTLVIGRICGSAELGIYAVCFTIIVLSSAACESLVIAPYMALSKNMSADSKRIYLGSIVSHQLLLAIALSAGLIVAVTIFGSFEASGLQNPLLLLAVILPAILARELARRYSMAEFTPQDALVIDLAAAVLQLACILTLAASAWLTVPSALLAIGFANLVSLIPWRMGKKFPMKVAIRAVRDDFARNYKLGVGNLAALATFLGQLYLAPWLLVLIADAAAVGLFAACHALVMVTNPLTQGIANSLMPRSVIAWSHGDGAQIRSLVERYSALLGVAMALLCLPLVLFGNAILSSLFGDGFDGQGTIVGVLAIAAMVRAVAMSAYIGLWAVGRSHVNAAVNVAGLIFLVLALPQLFPAFGLQGAAIAVLVADSFSAMARFVLFYQNTRRAVRNEQPV
jgi:O-antigen/teichoic acid export membrane protein